MAPALVPSPAGGSAVAGGRVEHLPVREGHLDGVGVRGGSLGAGATRQRSDTGVCNPELPGGSTDEVGAPVGAARIRAVGAVVPVPLEVQVPGRA